eukprot:1122521-Prymnesium_polylepis.1
MERSMKLSATVTLPPGFTSIAPPSPRAGAARPYGGRANNRAVVHNAHTSGQGDGATFRGTGAGNEAVVGDSQAASEKADRAPCTSRS